MQRTVLAYPKDMFTKKQVIKEINKFQYPKAWRYSSKGLHHYLILEPRLFEKHYVNHRNKTISPGRRLLEQKSIIDSINIPRVI